MGTRVPAPAAPKITCALTKICRLSRMALDALFALRCEGGMGWFFYARENEKRGLVLDGVAEQLNSVANQGFRGATPWVARRAALLRGAAWFALASVIYAGPAAAQEGDAPESDAAEAAAADETAARDRDTERLVITATRRDNVTVQDVPLSVQAFDAELLENSNLFRVNDLEQLSPSIQISQGQSASAGTIVSIRGIGTSSDNFGFEPAVGIFVDGVYRTRTGIGISELPELASVEVLRGPQGTLFGRNTSAGVINIQTAMPTFEPFTRLTIGAGNFDSVEAELTVSGPMSDTLAFRIDTRYRKRDGFINDLNTGERFNDIDRFFARAQILWEKDEASLRLIADFADTDENCCAATLIQAGAPATVPGSSPLVPIIGSSTADAINAGAAANGLIGTVDQASGFSPFDGAYTPGRAFADDVEEFGFSAEYNNRFEFGRFTSITSYRDFSTFRNQDIDFTGLDRAFRTGSMNQDRTFTQEIRLQNKWGRLDWLVGGFFLNQRIDFTDSILLGADGDFFTDSVFADFTGSPAVVGAPLQLFGTLPGALPFFPAVFGPQVTGGLIQAGILTPQGFLPGSPVGGGQRDRFDLDTNSFAVFTHNEIEITDALSATIGVRYSYDERDLEADLVSAVPACDAIAALPPEIGAVFRTGQPFNLGGLLACNPAINTEFNGQLSDSRTDSEITGTFRLAYQATDDLLIFGGFARGFKSGSFNLGRQGLESSVFAPLNPATGQPLSDGPQASDLEFEEEEINSFEGGFKSEWFDGALIVNASGFYQDIKGFQELIFTGSNFVTTGVDVINYGVEADVFANPFEGLTVQYGFAWTIAERTEDLPTVPGTDGQQLGNVPEYVLTGATTYVRPITPDLEAFVHANVRWQSATNIVANEFANALASNDAFSTVGARIGLRAFDGRYEVSAFATNLFNEEFNVLAFAFPEQINNLGVFPGEPRFWGAELKINFQ